jgi:hypothetical protein
MRRLTVIDVCGQAVTFRLVNGLEDLVAATETLPRVAVDAGDDPDAGKRSPEFLAANARIAARLLALCSIKPKIVAGGAVDDQDDGRIYADEIPTDVKFATMKQLLAASGLELRAGAIVPFSEAGASSGG